MREEKEILAERDDWGRDLPRYLYDHPMQPYMVGFITGLEWALGLIDAREEA